MDYSTSVNRYSKTPINRTKTFDAFVSGIKHDISIPVYAKDRVACFHPCTWVQGCESKVETNALVRTMIMFDFDGDGSSDPDIDYILSVFAKYNNVAYTTYSHKAEKINKETGESYVCGNRYRVIVPITNRITKDDWVRNYRDRLKVWVESVGFVGGNCVDESAYKTFAQIGLQPATNPLSTVKAMVWDNITGIELDLDQLLSTIVVAPKITAKPIETFKLDFSSAESIYIGDIMTTKASTGKLGYGLDREERMQLMAALLSCGVSELAIAQIDDYVRKADTNSSTRQLMNEVERKFKAKHPGLVLKYLTREERMMAGFAPQLPTVEEIIAESACEYTNDITGEYLSRADYGTAKKVLMIADLGTGKNHTWTTHTNTDDDTVIVLSPLISIVRQSGSDGYFDEKYKKQTTYVYDRAKDIVKMVGDKSIDISTHTLVIDECHNLLHADYRQSALRNIEKLLEMDWKQVILQSGTVQPDSFGDFWTPDEVIRFRKKNPMTKSYYHVDATGLDRVSTVIDLLIERTNAGDNVILLQNDKQALEIYKRALDDRKIESVLVDAERVRKSGDEAHRMANSSDYKLADYNGARVIMGTTSLVEGISIKDNINNASAIVIGPEAIEYITQLCGRYRAAKHITCYHLYSDKEDVDQIDTKKWFENEMINTRRNGAKIANIISAAKLNIEQRDLLALGKIHDSTRNADKWSINNGIFWDDNELCAEVTNLSVLFARKKINKFLFYRSADVRNHLLASNGFVNKGSHIVAATEDGDKIAAIKALVNAYIDDSNKAIDELYVEAIKRTKSLDISYVDMFLCEADEASYVPKSKHEFGRRELIRSYAGKTVEDARDPIAIEKCIAAIQSGGTNNKLIVVKALADTTLSVGKNTILTEILAGIDYSADDLNSAIAKAITAEIDESIAADATLNATSAFKLLRSNSDLLRKADISVIGGSVESKTAKPSQVIKSRWGVAVESKRVGRGDKRLVVYRLAA